MEEPLRALVRATLPRLTTHTSPQPQPPRHRDLVLTAPSLFFFFSSFSLLWHMFSQSTALYYLSQPTSRRRTLAADWTPGMLRNKKIKSRKRMKTDDTTLLYATAATRCRSGGGGRRGGGGAFCAADMHSPQRRLCTKNAEFEKLKKKKRRRRRDVVATLDFRSSLPEIRELISTRQT